MGLRHVCWGAYGLEIVGLEHPEHVLTQVQPGWPCLTIAQRRPDPGDRRPLELAVAEHRFDDERAELWMSDTEFVQLDRRPDLTVTFVTETQVPDDLVAHPYVVLPAAVAGRWAGHQLLHGGAVVVGDRAWGILGTKEAGKSSTLAALATQGCRIVTDDLLVIDHETLFAGPRSIDLRDDAAEILGGERVQVHTGRSRWRLRPTAVAPAVALGGFIHLAWGDQTRIERIPPAARLPLLIENSVFGPTAIDSAAYLELAGLTTLRFERPRGLATLASSTAQLLEALA